MFGAKNLGGPRILGLWQEVNRLVCGSSPFEFLCLCVGKTINGKGSGKNIGGSLLFAIKANVSHLTRQTIVLRHFRRMNNLTPSELAIVFQAAQSNFKLWMDNWPKSSSKRSYPNAFFIHLFTVFFLPEYIRKYLIEFEPSIKLRTANYHSVVLDSHAN